MVPRTLRRAFLFGLFVLFFVMVVKACSPLSTGTGTIEIVVTEGKGDAGLGIERCSESLDANAILSTVTVRDENGGVVTQRTLRGRDATTTNVGVDRRRCAIKAVMKVAAPRGERYSVTAGGYTQTVEWGDEGSALHWLYGEQAAYEETATVHLPAAGEQSEIASLVDGGYMRLSEISRMWNLSTDRVRQIVIRDDFPAPVKTVGTRNLWLLEDLGAWWFRDGRHAPS